MLWAQGAPVGDERIVYVKHSDMEEAALHISCGDWPTVERVVRVLPAGCAHLQAIDALVRLQSVDDACQQQSIDTPAFLGALIELQSPVRGIVQAACELLNALRRYDVNAVRSYGTQLGILCSATTTLPRSTQRLLVKLAQFVDEFGRTSLHEWTLPAFFLHEDTSAKNRSWWKKPSSLAESFDKAHQRFPAILTGSVPPSLLKIRTWIRALQEQAAELHLSNPSIQTESDVFRQASAFMTASADIHYANNSYVLALLALHRAAEWLLAAKCADQELLDFSSYDGVRMAVGEKKQVSFDVLLTSFINQGQTLNGMAADLAKLNTWRNLFAYTHHMSCPRSDDANILFSKVRGGLPSIANTKWKRAVEALSLPWPVSLEDMLDPNGELRNSFMVLSVDALILE
ncbi:hypothetical protein [Stutzerimonas stutzeri]|uniref:hypothetical protein n=1 Tax=Stutzerimonas stutzeri TaxID=316 RepID=UPI000A6D5A64|nr:hypothetical protein [Stutzerimonas stutzeri]